MGSPVGNIVLVQNDRASSPSLKKGMIAVLTNVISGTPNSYKVKFFPEGESGEGGCGGHGPLLPNGSPRVAYDSFDSLVHRLLHASGVIPLGRAHLFECLALLRAANRLKGKH